MPKSEYKTYKIKSLDDIVTKIPQEALPRFLEEFSEMIIVTGRTKRHLQSMLPWWLQWIRVRFKEFIWIDDGERHITPFLNGKEAPDGESK